MNNQEHIRTFKHIQWNSHALILDSHYDNINKQLWKGIIPSCKIYVVEEETLGRGPKGRGKEELREKEWVSGRPRYEKITQLH